MPKAQVKAIYKKPLAGDMQGDVESVLKRLKTHFLRRLKSKLQQTTFSHAAKSSLAKAMRVEVKKSSILLTVKHPAWRPLIEGQKKGPMVWLKRAKAPIPIITETGKLIFRSATPKSFANGKWIHPGRKSSNFVEIARKESREWAKKAFKPLIAKEIAHTLSGKKR